MFLMFLYHVYRHSLSVISCQVPVKRYSFLCFSFPTMHFILIHVYHYSLWVISCYAMMAKEKRVHVFTFHDLMHSNSFRLAFLQRFYLVKYLFVQGKGAVNLWKTVQLHFQFSLNCELSVNWKWRSSRWLFWTHISKRCSADSIPQTNNKPNHSGMSSLNI